MNYRVRKYLIDLASKEKTISYQELSNLSYIYPYKDECELFTMEKAIVLFWIETHNIIIAFI